MDSPYYYDQNFVGRTIRVKNRYFKVAEHLDGTLITSNRYLEDGRYKQKSNGNGFTFQVEDISYIYPVNTSLKEAWESSK